jgi:hypothetical protein
MSHRGVETVLGRLATDAETRGRFVLAPAETLRELTTLGIELTPVEIEALRTLDPEALDPLARALDQRLRKAALGVHPAGGAAPADGGDKAEGR